MHAAIRSQFLALLALAAIVLLVEHLIVTDAEAIEALAERAAVAAAERDFQTLGEMLSEDFTYGSRDRAETLAHLEGLLQKHPATGIEIQLFEIKVDDGRATAEGVVGAQLYGRPIRVGIDAEFVETAAGWKLARVKGSEGYVR